MQRRFLRVPGFAVCALLAGLPQLAWAAEATDVLDAIDGDDLFDANVELIYRGHAKTAKITREDVRNGRQVDVNEFLYFEHKHEVVPRLRIGIFQDIELFIALPYTVWEQRTGWQHYRNPNNRDPRRKGYSTFLRDQCMYGSPTETQNTRPKACDTGDAAYPQGRNTLSGEAAVSYTHLTLPTNREV